MANPTASKKWVDLEFLSKCEPLVVSGLPKHKFQPGSKVSILNGKNHGRIATVIALRAYGNIFTDGPLLGIYHQNCLEKVHGDAEECTQQFKVGDRIYHEEAPTLRSLTNKDNHQAGNGAYKIREYNEQRGLGVSPSAATAGESYLERPINATEAEQLMGWEVGSTAIGINHEGDEITISQTQRIKMLGNGIIPAEITNILSAIKPIISHKLESEIPSEHDFAYRQLRQRKMSHAEAIAFLTAK
ncbi:hypothetical protein [Nostoc sp.]|uniref:hypothetical protein n=1 Tax=Nostoc sp. TaxID=1180 RepID=UPI002FF787BD